ncbi:MAG: TIGR03668 family PPOX class F420-dependent oxidoreductase [Blastocatellia bacterium]
MAFDIDDNTRDFICGHRVARLATADGDGRPTVVPICYVFEGDCFYSPIDEKPKTVSPRGLKRVRNIESNPHVSLVIDDYTEDWSNLAYAIVSGLAEIMLPCDEHKRAVALLRDKYPQYIQMALDERMMIKITPTRIKRWSAGR